MYKIALLSVGLLVLTTTLAGTRGMLAVNEDNDRYLLNAKARDLTVEGLLEYVDSVAAGGAVTHFFNAPYWREPERRMLYAGELTKPEIVRARRRFPVGC